MSDSPLELDLKFLPDWVKEAPSTNRYADYQGEFDNREGRPRGRDDRGPRDPRSAPRGPRPERRGPAGPRRDDSRGPRGDRPPGDRSRGPRPGGDRAGGNRPDKRFSKPYGQRDDARPPREAPKPAPATLRIEFLPEPNAATGISRQIKASGRAYPVFGTGKLFLERPERHRVRVTSENPEVALFQIGDGPISFDRAAVERNAFLTAKTEFYTEETIQGEPMKGNFSNVARVRGTGTLLGPTNYHGYQPALRKLYEERYSRRMSFPEFQQHEIEIVSDEQAVADWKEQARTTTNYVTIKEAEPLTFKSAFDAEQHFRKQYLPQIVKSGTTLECNGQASRSGADRFVAGAVRDAWEKESHFPQQVVNGLRSYFMEAGLHYFKHRKRVLYVSSTKPARHPAGQIFSDGISSILATVEASPRIKRPDLAAKILGDQHDAPEAAARKEQLASDLHYLIHAGHVIEFSNGMLELPLAPQDKSAQEKSGKDRAAKPAAGEAAEAVDESAEAEAGEATPEASVDTPHQAEAPATSPTPAEVESESSGISQAVPSNEPVKTAAPTADLVIIPDSPVVPSEHETTEPEAPAASPALESNPAVHHTAHASTDATTPVPAEPHTPVPESVAAITADSNSGV